MNRRFITALILVMAALLIPMGAYADDVPDEPKDVEKMWPKEVPTPWFCHGVHPVYVCVPPW